MWFLTEFINHSSHQQDWLIAWAAADTEMALEWLWRWLQSRHKHAGPKDTRYPERPALALPVALPSTRRALPDLTAQGLNRRTIQLCAHQQV